MEEGEEEGRTGGRKDGRGRGEEGGWEEESKRDTNATEVFISYTAQGCDLLPKAPRVLPMPEKCWEQPVSRREVILIVSRHT